MANAYDANQWRKERKELTDRIWQLTEPSLKGYSNMIQRLLDNMPTQILQEIVTDIDQE